MYQLLSTLQGARDAVISLSFSTPTKFVAAAGYGGVTVWNLSTSSAVSIPSNVYNPRNPGYIYTACNFLHFEQADQYILLLGSQDGMFSTLKWDGEDHVFNPGFQIKPDDSRYQVVSLDVYQTEVPTGKLARVVVATADSRIAVYSLSSSLEVKKIYAIFIEEFSPLAARFCTRTRDVYVFEQTGGGILQLDDKSGEIKSHQSFGPDPMGTICMDESSKYFVACTGKAFEMFRLDTIEYVRRFDSGPPVVLFPKVSTFAENGNILVGGTDSGRAIVFDVSSGAQIQQLDYPKGGLVQPVAACTIEDGFLVAIAGSTLEHPADVLIFKQALISPSTASKDTPATVNFFHHLRRKGSLGHYFLLTLCILLAMNGLHSFVLTCTPLVRGSLNSPHYTILVYANIFPCLGSVLTQRAYVDDATCRVHGLTP
ncbi:WD40-repeat-containing domain protein [Lentinula raphanica]|uniref:WD40-repeat-containing domain protein n=1 Tax=Lentinula raphanica TaxID=153919 RepID=A0AA38U9K4_9AGAR|nr:WD40-repeat-containing domain protein [Lentinula raphanica]